MYKSCRFYNTSPMPFIQYNLSILFFQIILSVTHFLPPLL